MQQNTQLDTQNEDLIQPVEYFWDIGTQKYVMLMLDTQEIKVVEKEHIRREFAQKLGDTYKFLKGEIFLKQEFIKTVFLTFNPHKEFSWKSNGFLYQNIFIPSKILLHSREVRKNILHKYENIDFLEKYPHINALFKNMFLKKDRIEFFINWLSYIFVTMKKTRTAVVLKGIQGSGKGVMWEQLIQYFSGKNYTFTIDNDVLSSRFTPKMLEYKTFVLGNEIKGDFKDGNNNYEKAKMWVADNTIKSENKGKDAVEVDNYFNMLFFTNHEIPMQIQKGDRRYTVFQTGTRKLDYVAEEDFKISIEQFIENIQKERDDFLVDLFCYNFDKEKACVCMETEEKERIYRGSVSKIEIMADKIKTFDEKWFANDLQEYFEQIEENTRKELLESCKITEYIEDGNNNTLLMLARSMKKFAFENHLFKNSDLVFIYRVFIDNSQTATYNKIGTSLNSYFGQSTTIPHPANPKTTMRVRGASEFEDENYLKTLIPF